MSFMLIILYFLPYIVQMKESFSTKLRSKMKMQPFWVEENKKGTINILLKISSIFGALSPPWPAIESSPADPKKSPVKILYILTWLYRGPRKVVNWEGVWLIFIYSCLRAQKTIGSQKKLLIQEMNTCMLAPSLNDFPSPCALTDHV